jgi:hypothetical protein
MRENEKKCPKEEKNNNLNEIMTLLLQQYQDSVNRKEGLENKALGYLTPLSILLTATVGIMIMIAQGDGEKGGLQFFLFMISIILFALQVYFSILTFIFALKAYSVKTSHYPDIEEYTKKWRIKKADFLGGMNKAFVRANNELDGITKRLADDVKNCRIFLIFSMVLGILNIICFIMYLLTH